MTKPRNSWLRLLLVSYLFAALVASNSEASAAADRLSCGESTRFDYSDGTFVASATDDRTAPGETSFEGDKIPLLAVPHGVVSIQSPTFGGTQRLGAIGTTARESPSISVKQVCGGPFVIRTKTGTIKLPVFVTEGNDVSSTKTGEKIRALSSDRIRQNRWSCWGGRIETIQGQSVFFVYTDAPWCVRYKARILIAKSLITKFGPGYSPDGSPVSGIDSLDLTQYSPSTSFLAKRSTVRRNKRSELNGMFLVPERPISEILTEWSR
jgi:hypothetical protein